MNPKKFRVNMDSLMNLLYITDAVEAVHSNTEDLEVPGLPFLDHNSTEGTAKVMLLNGGIITLDMEKNGIPLPYVVRRVFVDDTTATGIQINPISQRAK